MASLAEGCPLSIQQGTTWACAAEGPHPPHLGRLDLEALVLIPGFLDWSALQPAMHLSLLLHQMGPHLAHRQQKVASQHLHPCLPLSPHLLARPCVSSPAPHSPAARVRWYTQKSDQVFHFLKTC